jgi:hypothetical protein
VKTRNILGFIGIALALVGGYLWMIALILWGVTFLIILRLKKMNNNKVNRRNKLKDRH